MLVCSIKAVNLLPKRTLGNITVKKKDPKMASLVPLVGVRCEGSPGVTLSEQTGPDTSQMSVHFWRTPFDTSQQQRTIAPTDV